MDASYLSKSKSDAARDYSRALLWHRETQEWPTALHFTRASHPQSHIVFFSSICHFVVFPRLYPRFMLLELCTLFNSTIQQREKFGRSVKNMQLKCRHAFNLFPLTAVIVCSVL